jgi:hypothetical protein
MSEYSVLEVIERSIQSANIDFPDAGDGTTRDRIYHSQEDSLHLARAVMAGLTRAGYKIAKE